MSEPSTERICRRPGLWWIKGHRVERIGSSWFVWWPAERMEEIPTLKAAEAAVLAAREVSQ